MNHIAPRALIRARQAATTVFDTMGYWLVPLLCCMNLGACVSPAPNVNFGVQPEHSAYIPARIAILSCRAWPAGARFQSLPLSTDPASMDGLCQNLERFIVSGFSQQPYMKGYSPKFVAKTLADAKQGDLLNQITEHWRHESADCQDCQNAAAFYTASIAKRPEWLLWINNFAKATRNVDAMLLPFVTFAASRAYDDRGLQVAERAAGVALLLIDTNNGQLLWAGGREAAASNKRLGAAGVTATPAPPPWSEVEQRLLTEELWREFPGRQVF